MPRNTPKALSKKWISPFALLLTLSLALSLPFFRKTEPDLTVMGYLNARDGLGKQTLDLIESFREEMRVHFVPTRKGKMWDVDPKLSKYIRKSSRNKKLGKVILFEDMIWSPHNSAEQMLQNIEGDPIKIAYSMWESSRLPDEWVQILNRHFDAVCVPSAFLVEVYQKSGVVLPIFELPLWRDLQPFAKQPLKQSKNTPFVFANFSACSFRKNHLLLVQAFEKAFGNRNDVRLHINSRYGEKEATSELSHYIAKQSLNNVSFTHFALSFEEYMDAFTQVDCYVSPSKGEGFSIQPREAMALGIPVIASNNTGQIDICKTGLVYSLETKIEEAALYPWDMYFGKNYTCQLDALANALIHVFENYESYLHKGEASRAWAMQFDLNSLKEKYATLIRPKQVVLGDRNTIEGDTLITNSATLCQKYQNRLTK